MIVAVGCLLSVVANANSVSFGVFFKPIATDLGWNRSQISGALVVSSLVTAVSATYVGYWADRYGARKVLLPSFTLLGIGFILMGRVSSLWHLYLDQGLIFGIGSAGPFACLAAIAGRWHERRRGLAVGLVVAGVGLSAMIFPPLAARAIQAMDWRHAATLFGIIVFVVGASGSMLLSNPPAYKVNQSSTVPRPRRGPIHAWLLMVRLFKNLRFSMLIAIFLMASIGTGLMNNHFVNYATDAGVMAVVAASMVGVMGIANVVGRLSMGTISDWMGTKGTLATCFVLTTTALTALELNATGLLLWVAVAAFGCGYGGMVPMITRSLAESFGVSYLSTLSGMMITGVQIGLAVGAWTGGWTYDVSGNYRWAFGIAAGAAFISLVFALRLHPISPNERELAQEKLQSIV